MVKKSFNCCGSYLNCQLDMEYYKRFVKPIMPFYLKNYKSMKQELIAAFLVKNSGKLKVDEKIEIEKQLQTCDDKAFAILMSHKKLTTKSNFWRRLFCIIPIVAIVYLIASFCILVTELISAERISETYFVLLIFLGSIIVLIVSFILLRKWYKHGKLKRMPKRKRLYEDYLKIIQTYQMNTKSAE